MWVEQQLVGVWRRGVRKIFAEKWLKKHADREGKAMGYWGGGWPHCPKRGEGGSLDRKQEPGNVYEAEPII